MKAKKVLALVLCAALLVAGSVAATLAYLTSTTGVVTNTFTTGNVAITLDESVADVYGVKGNGTTTTGNEYKLIPGHTYVKDPTVHVQAGSEDCYLFVKVVNGISDIEADTTIAAQMAENGWTAVTNENGVYAYESKVSAGTDVKVFESFTVAGDAVLTNQDGTAKYSANTPITVQAYAVQADGFTDALDAWSDAALADWQ